MVIIKSIFTKFSSQGDSGAPLLCEKNGWQRDQYYLRGVFAASSTDAHICVFGDIQFSHIWIMNKMKNNAPQNKKMYRKSIGIMKQGHYNDFLGILAKNGYKK